MAEEENSVKPIRTIIKGIAGLYLDTLRETVSTAVEMVRDTTPQERIALTSNIVTKRASELPMDYINARYDQYKGRLIRNFIRRRNQMLGEQDDTDNK